MRTALATLLAIFTLSLLCASPRCALAAEPDAIIVEVLEEFGIEAADFVVDFDAKYLDMHGVKLCPEFNSNFTEQTLNYSDFRQFHEAVREKLDESGFEPYLTIQKFVCERLEPATPPMCP